LPGGDVAPLVAISDEGALRILVGELDLLILRRDAREERKKAAPVGNSLREPKGGVPR
jgi:hypothetical protein